MGRPQPSNPTPDTRSRSGGCTTSVHPWEEGIASTFQPPHVLGDPGHPSQADVATPTVPLSTRLAPRRLRGPSICPTPEGRPRCTGGRRRASSWWNRWSNTSLTNSSCWSTLVPLRGRGRGRGRGRVCSGVGRKTSWRCRGRAGTSTFRKSHTRVVAGPRGSRVRVRRVSGRPTGTCLWRRSPAFTPGVVRADGVVGGVVL